MRKIITTLGLAGAFALAGLAVATTGAATANPRVPDCSGTVLYTATEGVTLTAGGKATLQSDGLLLETTVNDDAVNWKRTLAAPVALKDVHRLAYRTRKIDPGTANSSAAVALPAYRLYLVDTDGANETTTLVYEPYWQTGAPYPAAVGVTTTWNARAGKWWSSKTIAGQTAGAGGPPFATLEQVVAANPTAKVAAYGVGQGTYNPGTTAKVDDVVFGAAGKCTVTNWTVQPSSPSSSASATASASSKPPSASASGSASQSPTASPTSASASASTTPPVVTRPPTSGGLALTGTPVAAVAGLGVALVLAGGALVTWLWRRNRIEYRSQ